MPLILQGATSGQATLQATDAATVTLTLPASTGTLVVTGGAQTIEFADGSASAPSITNSGDTNTGMFFPAADTIAFTEGGTESMRIDSGGNVGIGVTPSGNYQLQAGSGSSAAGRGFNLMTVSGGYSGGDYPSIGYNFRTTTTSGSYLYNGTDIAAQVSFSTSGFTFNTAASGTAGNAITFSERMRIDSSGKFFVGATADIAGAGAAQGAFLSTTSGRFALAVGNNNGSAAYGLGVNSQTGENVYFYFQGVYKGAILTGSVGTSYVTSSDYRLKENIAPMTGALATVAQLKPVTYKWKSTGEDGQGFIAHELAEVVPECVTGEKDAMRTEKYEITPVIPATFDEEGNELTPAVEAVMGEREVPDYQGIDTSFLVATLTAAIQELKATVDAQAARIAALEGAK